MKFLKDGIPLSDCQLYVLFSGNNGNPEVFQLGNAGEVRIPGSYAGHKSLYALKRGDEVLYTVYEPKFERGLTSVNFRLSGIESTYKYRFLFYDATKTSKSINLAKEESEQDAKLKNPE